MTIIDRFEGNIAVIETENGTVTLQRSLLPQNACEGDVLVCENGIWLVDTETTENRRNLTKQRLGRLINKNQKRGKK